MRENFKRIQYIIIVGLLTVSISAQQQFDQKYLERLENDIDLSLPNWGPYSTKYVGISHIPDTEKGVRFDLSVYPGYYRQKVMIPNVLFESGYHNWEATPDLKYFSYRHELEWKDQVYTDISYAVIDNNSRLIRAEFVNNTTLPQNLTLHYTAFFNYPDNYGYDVILPESGIWIDAMDYVRIKKAKSNKRDRLVYDGWLKGEKRDKNFVNGRGLGKNFGNHKGDQTSYTVNVPKNIRKPSILIRYRSKKDQNITFRADKDYTLNLKKTKKFSVQSLEIAPLSRGNHEFSIIFGGGSSIEFDGFAIAASEEMAKVTFKKRPISLTPEILEGPNDRSIILKYTDSDTYYGIAWEHPNFKKVEYLTEELDVFLRRHVNRHTSNRWGEGPGHFYDVDLNPIVVAPQSTNLQYGLVCEGSKEEVTRRLLDFTTNNDKESIYTNAKKKLVDLNPIPSGKPYQFSQERMMATTFTNVIYPVYTRGQWIKHNPPGRQWLSLYTWDSGFIGLGMADLDLNSAIEVLNQYVTSPDDQSAFVHHGTSLPIQIYLYKKIWDKNQSKELLAYFYPRVKQMYDFLAGNISSSTTRDLNSNLLKTWDYFYNSGGWDDYPPQHHLQEHPELYKTVTPAVINAHIVRTAKILQGAAEILNKTEDVTRFEKDIKEFSEALQKYSWDPKSGYYSYVVHNDKGEAEKLLTTDSGENFNKGMDGVSPLMAGICDNNQTKALLQHLFNENELWTKNGLTTVDQSAGYYRKDGYWNGAIWMPHQWFFWKTMLDIGESDRAFQIANTALEVWKKEVDASYHTFEHFLTETGRGAGWHQFGALSTPVTMWYSSYYRPGTITTGHNGWVLSKMFTNQNQKLDAQLKFQKQNITANPVVLVCLSPKNDTKNYIVKWNNQNVPFIERHSGLLEITIPKDAISGTLEVN